MDDCPSFPAAFLGALRIGVVPVPVNPLYGPDEYAYFVEDSGARLAIVDAACAEKVRAPKSLLVDELESSEELPPADTLRDDVAFWLYSSGSTGRPKGVVHLHRDLLYTCETYARHVLGITEADVTFSTTKLFHAYGLGNNLSFLTGLVRRPFSCVVVRRLTPSSRRSSGSPPRCSSRCRPCTTRCSRPGRAATSRRCGCVSPPRSLLPRSGTAGTTGTGS